MIENKPIKSVRLKHWLEGVLFSKRSQLLDCKTKHLVPLWKLYDIEDHFTLRWSPSIFN